MAGEITLQQLFQTPVIRRVISRIRSPISLFQQFYGMSPGAQAVTSISGRYLGWDIYDFTRSIAKGRAPGSGPATVSPKPVGHVSAMAYRMHEKVVLEQEKIFRARPLGTDIGTVDLRGQSYIQRQLSFLTQRFRNAREFMISRMFRGGFGIKLEGEDWIPVEKDDPGAVFTVDFQIPADNLGGCQMGTGSNILQGDWNDPASDIVGQVLKLDKAFERVSGRALRHFWIDGTTFGHMLKNTKLQQIGGQAFRVFDSITRREIQGGDGLPDTGYDVIFRALPLYTFHVYNAVLLASGGDDVSFEESISVAGTQQIVPSGKIIGTPEPSPEWVGWVEGSEVVAENLLDAGREVFGFHSWTTRVIDPAGWELKMIDNGLPALYVPRAVIYGTIYMP